MTGGLFYNDNKFDLTGQASKGTFNFNGVIYTVAQAGSVSANVTFNSVTPHIGFGWGDNSDSAGLHLTSDLGVMYQGSPKASISATGAANDPQLASNVREAQSKLQPDLNKFQCYPVVQIGVVYRF